LVGNGGFLGGGGGGGAVVEGRGTPTPPGHGILEGCIMAKCIFQPIGLYSVMFQILKQ